MGEVECAVDAAALLGECPVWSVAEQALYWVDIDSCAVHRFDPAGGADEVRILPGRPGSLALTRTPGLLLVASEHELVWLDWTLGTVHPWLPVEDAELGNRMNDGRCDPAGRFVVGTMWPTSAEGRFTGALYQIGADGSVATLRTEVGVPNGIAFDPALERTYFADTPSRTIWVWDYDAERGVRHNERVFFDYGDLPGKPDGACIDADGCYWSACVRGWAIVRITPDGDLDRRIELPVEKPSMPAFGDSDLSTLYITTIGAGGSYPEQAGRDRFTPGALLALDVGVAGLPEPVFAGSPPI